MTAGETGHSISILTGASPRRHQGPGSFWCSPACCPYLHHHSGSKAVYFMLHLNIRILSSVPDPMEPPTADPVESDHFLQPYPLGSPQRHPASGICLSPACSLPSSEALLSSQNTHPNLCCLLMVLQKAGRAGIKFLIPVQDLRPGDIMAWPSAWD